MEQKPADMQITPERDKAIKELLLRLLSDQEGVEYTAVIEEDLA